jgi:hypothetical protein
MKSPITTWLSLDPTVGHRGVRRRRGVGEGGAGYGRMVGVSRAVTEYRARPGGEVASALPEPR